MKKYSGKAQTLAAVVLTVTALALLGNKNVYGQETVAGNKNKTKDSTVREDVVTNREEVKATAKLMSDRDTISNIVPRTESTATGAKHSLVWVVVVMLVLSTVGFWKAGDHFYKKFLKDEEEKTKAKGRII